MLLQKTEKDRRGISISEALKIIERKKLLKPDIIDKIDKLRKVRNMVVHNPNEIKIKALIDYHELNQKIVLIDRSNS